MKAEKLCCGTALLKLYIIFSFIFIEMGFLSTQEMCEELPIGSQSTVRKGFSGHQVLQKHCVQTSKAEFSVNLCGCQEPVPSIYCIKHLGHTEQQSTRGWLRCPTAVHLGTRKGI